MHKLKVYWNEHGIDVGGARRPVTYKSGTKWPLHETRQMCVYGVRMDTSVCIYIVYTFICIYTGLCMRPDNDQ
jgi:hypothetical protein